MDLPMEVYQDKALNWTDLAVYYFFVKCSGDPEKVLKELELANKGLSNRRFKEIKQRLEKQGHITVIMEGKRRRYVPLDAQTMLWGKICALRAASKVGLGSITDTDIFSLQKNHSLQHIYKQMSIIEIVYRKNKLKLVPIKVLGGMCIKGMNPPQQPFDYDWWQKDLEQNAKVQQARKEAEVSEKELEKQRLRQEELEKRLDSLSEAEKAALKERAIESLKQAGQWPLQFASEIGIRLMMRKMVEKEA